MKILSLLLIFSSILSFSVYYALVKNKKADFEGEYASDGGRVGNSFTIDYEGEARATRNGSPPRAPRHAPYNTEMISIAIDKVKEAWSGTKEGLGKAKESVAEKVPGAAKTMENVKKIGQDIQKVHHSLWDERSAKTKFNGFRHELSANFSYLSTRGVEILYDVAQRAVSEKVMEATMSVVQLLGLSVSFGAHVWVCFVSDKILATILTTKQYVEVKSKIYQLYFPAFIGGISCSFLAYFLKTPNFHIQSFEFNTTYLSLCLGFVNWFYTVPAITKALSYKMKLERKVGQDGGKKDNSADPDAETSHGQDTSRCQLQEMEKHLKNLRTLSSTMDVVTLLALTAQVVHVSKSISI